jgi:hypothetical protein
LAERPAIAPNGCRALKASATRVSLRLFKEAIMSFSDRPEVRAVVPARQARQGVTGHNVRYVLGFSVAAIIIVFGIIWLIYFA